MKGAQRAFLISFVFVLKLTSASTTSDDLYSSSSSSNRIPGSYPSEVSSLHEVSDYEDCNSDFFETVDTSRPTSVRFHSDVSPQDSGLFSPGLPPSSHVVPTTTQAPAPISPPVTANIVKQTLLSKPSTDRLATLQSSNPPIIFRFINADRQDLISWNEQQLKTLIKTNVNTVHHHCDVGRGLTAFGNL